MRQQTATSASSQCKDRSAQRLRHRSDLTRVFKTTSSRSPSCFCLDRRGLQRVGDEASKDAARKKLMRRTQLICKTDYYLFIFWKKIWKSQTADDAKNYIYIYNVYIHLHLNERMNGKASSPTWLAWIQLLRKSLIQLCNFSLPPVSS